ncbi:FKBP-type peptidyl-prolyl cis-trans isomerase [Candidatus Dependentiae bacterium]|nr:FKBP-type peptidyl-prolyl cis-trans isomerase [Candidatus Dependentiae bacterium]
MPEITLPSGLGYTIINHGNGQTTAQPGSIATVHYTGWLDNAGVPGKKFDSSVDRGNPFSFVLGAGNVIKGWDEGVLEMRVGEKRRLVIPSHLGYGSQGYPGVIPPNATLIFDVELLSFE